MRGPHAYRDRRVTVPQSVGDHLVHRHDDVLSPVGVDPGGGEQRVQLLMQVNEVVNLVDGHVRLVVRLRLSGGVGQPYQFTGVDVVGVGELPPLASQVGVRELGCGTHLPRRAAS